MGRKPGFPETFCYTTNRGSFLTVICANYRSLSSRSLQRRLEWYKQIMWCEWDLRVCVSKELPGDALLPAPGPYSG